MKATAKNIGKLLMVMLFTVFGMSNAKAQSHNKAAANCIYHTASKTKNAVSCVDCYCKTCGDKKKKEKEVKKKAEGLGNKKTTPTKKNGTTTTTKTKNDEAVLVAPKASVLNSNSTSKKLSAKDQEIVELSKKVNISIDYDNEKTVSIYYSNDGNKIILKDNLDIKTKYPFTFCTALNMPNQSQGVKNAYQHYGYSENAGFEDTGFFIVNFYNDISITSKKRWWDLVDFQGNCVFDSEEITSIKYQPNKTYKIGRQKIDKTTGKYMKPMYEEYNPVTKSITPIN